MSTLVKPLTQAELQEKAPSIYTTQPSYKVSDKYSFIPTTTILEDLDKLGWQPYQAMQRKSRAQQDMLFTKHMIRLRNNSIGQLGDSIPEIILTNSHDGRNSFNLHAGLFRLVCSNGLVIADTTFDEVKIKHQWYSMDEIEKVINTMVGNIPSIVTNVNRMDQTELTDSQQIEFGKKAMLTRWTKGNEALDVDDLVQANRVADRGNSVWKVYNVVQEKLVKGGLVFNNDKEKMQKLRPIVNIDQQIKINQNLWSLAESYI
tara:strand:- start:827 stop:1606 length:780 start_codon:yes stop_codon:yes gene_type:complete